MVNLTISTDDDRIVSINVDADEEVDNVKALLEVETQVPSAQQRLLFNGQELPSGAKLSDKGVGDGDLLLLIRAQQAPPPGAGGGGGAGFNSTGLSNDGTAIDPAAMITFFKSQPEAMRQIQEGNPELYQAIMAGDANKLQQVLRSVQMQKNNRELEMQRQIMALNADPLDFEAQAKIEEMIRQKNVEENMMQAYEHTPESFGSVQMLYVDMEVNGHPLKAFVDSGAQSTIMSEKCAQRCGIMRLVDKRYAGIAKGVGTGKITGRVHSAPLKIGNTFLPCSFTLMENQDMEFLFGLDMLKRHQVSIDLKNNVLDFPNCGEKLPFLGDGDLPRHLLGMEEKPLEEGAGAGGAAGGGGGGGGGGDVPMAQAAAPAPAAAAGGGAAAAPSPWANPPPAAPAPAPAAAAAAAGGGRGPDRRGEARQPHGPRAPQGNVRAGPGGRAWERGGRRLAALWQHVMINNFTSHGDVACSLCRPGAWIATELEVKKSE